MTIRYASRQRAAVAWPALPDEDGAAHEQLLQALVADLRPQGAAETHLVQRMASTMWQQRRLERLEHAGMVQAAGLPVTPADIVQLMRLAPVNEQVLALWDLLDDTHALGDEDLAVAQGILEDCQDAARLPGLLLDPQHGPKAFPKLWERLMPPDWQEQPEWFVWLGWCNDPDDAQAQRQADQWVAQTREHFEALVFLLRHREAIAQARAALVAQRVAGAWDVERSQRQHAALDERLYRAMAELRQLQQWRRPPPPGPSGAGPT
jgi:hypothetical protein